jgi:hypothetical protein
MRLVHYSNKPVATVKSVAPRLRQARDGTKVGDKPLGLWVSDDDDENNWRRWCEAESVGMDRYRFAHSVTLAASANVLMVQGELALDAFHRQYRDVLYAGSRIELINWKRVCADYQGIVITPYLWSRRLAGPSWYYGWDCASGVVWDAAAIAEIGPPEPVSFMRESEVSQ